MAATIISYPPSGGGNHLKNLLCLDPSFANSTDLNLDNYVQKRREVHSYGGRNVRPEQIDAAFNKDQNWIIHGHFGEIGPHAPRVRTIKRKKFVVISIMDELDRKMLAERQNALGQWGHEYYMNEEQHLIYQPDFHEHYYGAKPDNIYMLFLRYFWHPNFVQSAAMSSLVHFLNINIDVNRAHELHSNWYTSNSTIHNFFKGANHGQA